MPAARPKPVEPPTQLSQVQGDDFNFIGRRPLKKPTAVVVEQPVVSQLDDQHNKSELELAFAEMEKYSHLYKTGSKSTDWISKESGPSHSQPPKKEEGENCPYVQRFVEGFVVQLKVMNLSTSTASVEKSNACEAGNSTAKVNFKAFVKKHNYRSQEQKSDTSEINSAIRMF